LYQPNESIPQKKLQHVHQQNPIKITQDPRQLCLPAEEDKCLALKTNIHFQPSRSKQWYHFVEIYLDEERWGRINGKPCWVDITEASRPNDLTPITPPMINGATKYARFNWKTAV